VRRRARALGGFWPWEGRAAARVGHAAIVGDTLPHERLRPAVHPLAEGGPPAPDRGAMLADAQGEALDEGGGALPAAGGQALLDRLQRAAHAPGLDADPTAPPHALAHWRREEPGQGSPAGGGAGPWARWRAGCPHCPS
jgi:hypothetical protein